MGETIEDGSGQGYSAKVDDENRLHTFSIAEPEDKHQARNGKAWSYDIVETPSSTAYFFRIVNTGVTPLAITGVRVVANTATMIDIDYVTGTPTYVSNTSVVPTNRNMGASDVPVATAERDVNITGLTDGGRLYFIRCDTADKEETLESVSNLIMPLGGAIAFKRVALTGTVEMVVSVIELD